MAAIQTRTRTLRVCTISTISVALCGLASAQIINSTERVSLATGSGEADGPSITSSISSDGRLVAFTSSATNLVAGDTNGYGDVFVRDRILGTTRRVSFGVGGVEPNLDALHPHISGDGRVVCFVSDATNLVPNDTNHLNDVFACDLATGAISLVSLSTNGEQGNLALWLGDVSGDGRFVVFSSPASNFVAGDSNGSSDVFLRDRLAGITTRVSVSSNGVQGTSWSNAPSISLNGRFVAFESFAPNLVPNDPNGAIDVFVRDTATGTTELVSLGAAGLPSDGNCLAPTISGDGRYVAFESIAGNLVANDSNGITDIFVRDRLAMTTVRVSVAPGGGDVYADSNNARISGDGRFVVFESLANTLVAGDNNAKWDVFVADRVHGSVARVSTSTAGVEGDGPSSAPVIDASGATVAFESSATNLVAGDNNASWDVFVTTPLAAAPATFCTAGTSSNGCLATLSANAQPHVTGAGTCQIVATGVEGVRPGMLFYGVDHLAFTPLPWGPGSSFLCLKSPIQRTVAQSSGGILNTCSGALHLDWQAFQAANPTALGAPWNVGEHVYVQAWFRDPPSPKSTSLSDALDMQYLP